MLVTKLCPTLMTPWTIACQAPLPMGFPRQEYFSGLPLPIRESNPGIFLTQESNPGLLHCRQILYSQLCNSREAWASLSSTISQSLLKLMSFESVMLSNHLILHHPLLFLPSIFPSIRVFSSELALLIRWTKNWSFSFSTAPVFPMNIQG